MTLSHQRLKLILQTLLVGIRFLRNYKNDNDSNVIFLSVPEISISNSVWVELSGPVRSSSNLEFPFRFAPGPSFQIVRKESLYSWLDKKTYRMEMLVSKTWRKKSNGQKVRSAFAIKTLMWWLPVFPCDTWYQSTQNTIRL